MVRTPTLATSRGQFQDQLHFVNLVTLNNIPILSEPYFSIKLKLLFKLISYLILH